MRRILLKYARSQGEPGFNQRRVEMIELSFLVGVAMEEVAALPGLSSFVHR